MKFEDLTGILLSYQKEKSKHLINLLNELHERLGGILVYNVCWV